MKYFIIYLFLVLSSVVAKADCNLYINGDLLFSAGSIDYYSSDASLTVGCNGWGGGLYDPAHGHIYVTYNGQTQEGSFTFTPPGPGDYNVQLVAVNCSVDNPNSCSSVGGNGTITIHTRRQLNRDCPATGPASRLTCRGSGTTMYATGTPTSSTCNQTSAGGCPVNLANGSLWHHNVDFVLAGRTPATALRLDRSYVANAAATPGGFGPNWHLGYETRIIQDPNQGIIWIDEFGGPWRFDFNGNPPPGLNAVITTFSDHIELLKQDRAKLYFSLSIPGVPYGRLYKISERHGESIDLAYMNGNLDTISTGLAGSVKFNWSGGRISSISRIRDNLSYFYSYDVNGRLASVTDFAGNTYQYAYNNGQAGTLAQYLLSAITDPLGRVLRFTYDDNGLARQQYEPGGGIRSFVFAPNKADMTEVDGQTYTYYIDNNGHTYAERLPDGTTKHLEWTNGHLTKSFSDMGGPTKMAFDANGNLSSLERPADGGATTITYDQTFNVPTLVTPLVGAPTSYSLDQNTGDVLQISRANLAESFTYDSFGNRLSVSNGKTTYADQRNADGLLTHVFDLHNSETRTYDARGRVATRQFQSGRTIAYGYDDFDRIVSIVDSNGPTTSNVYDAMGRLTQKTVSAGGVNQVTSYVYDDRDRLVSTTDPMGRVTTNHYDPVHVIDKPASVTDPAGRTTYFAYDKLQRLISKTDALGAVTSYTYDQRGNMTSVTDALGNVTRYAYDLNNRKIREDRPSVAGSVAARRVTLYFYDAADHLVREVTKSATNGADRAIYYQYDSLDRLVRRIAQKESSTGNNVVDDDSSFAYANELDATLMTSAVNGVASLSFNYESAPPFALTGYSVAASQSGNPFGLITGNFAVARDVTGEIASVAKDGTTLFSKSYDPAGRLTGVSTPGGFSSALGYDGFGRRTGIQHSDGAVGTFGFDLLDRPVSTSWTGPTPISEALQYDVAGNITQVQREGGVTANISYDAVDQLTASTGSLYSKSFVYDALGNRIGGSDGTGNIVSNFLLSNGSSAFQADPDGFGDTIMQTSGAVVKNYAYRADGLLSGFQSGSTQVAQYFDALKRRVAKVVNLDGTSYSESFLHQGEEDRVLLAKAGDGTITTYLDGQGVDDHLAELKGAGAKGYVTDHLGSILNADAAGSGHIFGLFGEGVTLSPSNSSGPVAYGFAGRELDETGLYYNRARNYSSSSGRFLSQDPAGQLSGDDNNYRYVLNNPVESTDSYGLWPDGPPMEGDPNGNVCLAKAAVSFGICFSGTPGGKISTYGKLGVSVPCLALFPLGAKAIGLCIYNANRYLGLSTLPVVVASVASCLPALEGTMTSCMKNSCGGK